MNLKQLRKLLMQNSPCKMFLETGVLKYLKTTR